MARKTAMITIKNDGRDKGKCFFLTEMDADRVESWATRALLALMKNGVEVPDNMKELGLAALAQMGLKSLVGLRWEDAEPLLSEMMTCVQIIPNPQKMEVKRNLIASDIEELMTRLELRKEIWALHTGFLQAVIPSTLGSLKGQAAEEKRGTKTSRA